MTEILLIASITLLLIAIVLIWFRNPHNPALAYLQAQVANLQTTVDKLESGLKEDFRINRIESADQAKANRQELNETLHGFKTEQTQTLATITTQNRQALIDINQTLDDKVKTLTTTLDNNNNLNRESLLNAFKTFQENFDAHIKTFNEVQRDKFSQMLTSQQTLIANTETKLENIRTTVEEKLEKTLSERLGQSFETVGKQLIEVQKGLGEMQTIATDVGGLKKVLSNVKLRGGVGEVQLALLLEQILAPNQYEANVKTKKGSSEPVEFAIKLPGRSDDENAFVYLPIDAKFPKDTYEHLLSAYETANPEEIEAATKNLETTIKKMAKDIRDKYLDPPNTTDFAILFLPFESIYAEVIRRTALIDQLRTEFKITVAGPTTLMAILNSLQMGFRTLALQKRSSEVWQVLATVKKEFENFGGLLEKAQKNIQTGLGQLDDVVGTRTRAIHRQLRNVESLPMVRGREEMPKMDMPIQQDLEE
jgi:DNA recombination protein RmuC